MHEVINLFLALNKKSFGSFFYKVFLKIGKV